MSVPHSLYFTINFGSKHGKVFYHYPRVVAMDSTDSIYWDYILVDTVTIYLIQKGMEHIEKVKKVCAVLLCNKLF